MAEQNKKAKIILEAVKVFAKDGFEKASIDMVALKAKVAKGTIFYHYKSKKGLFEAIITEGERKFNSEVSEKLGKVKSPAKKIEIVIDAERGFISKHKELFKVLIDDLLIKGRSFEIAENIITEGIKSGDFRSDISPKTMSASIFWLVAMTSLNGGNEGQEKIILEGIKK
ncbi:MAG: TetR/AcrR family transcriptional regulator [Bacteroidales bacterium]|nr:TetR/AcrR family transcriptional regulator [Bacteroidales bacterium]